MWPAAFWEKLYEPLIRRAAGLGRAAGRRGSRPLREGLRVLRRARDRRRPRRACGRARRRPRGRAGHPVRRGFPARRPAAGGPARDRRARRRRWVAAALAELATPAGRARDARAPRSSASTTMASTARSSAWPTTCGPAAAPAAPARLADRREARRAGGGRDRAADRVRAATIRPGVMLAGAVRTYVNRYGVLPGRRAVVFATGDDGCRTARDLADAGARSPRSSIRRPEPDPRLRALADAIGRTACVTARRERGLGRPGAAAVDDPGRGRPRRAHRLRPARRVERLEPDAAPDLAPEQQAASGTRRSAPSCRATSAAGPARGGQRRPDGSRSRARSPTARGWAPRRQPTCGFAPRRPRPAPAAEPRGPWRRRRSGG